METIKQPGKFESEPVWLPKLWEMIMDGGDDESFYHKDVLVSVFNVDKSLLDDIKGLGDDVQIGDKIEVWEGEQGFVYQNIVALSSKYEFNRKTSIKNL